MGSSQNDGLILVNFRTLNMRCRNITCDQEGAHHFENNPYPDVPPDSSLLGLPRFFW